MLFLYLFLEISASDGEGNMNTSTVSPSTSTNGSNVESVGQPYFDNATKREYTAAVGQPAYLHCRVRNLADRAV